MTSTTTLETIELADELRELLREHLQEEARRFYGDDATHFLSVKRCDHWLWSWFLAVGCEEDLMVLACGTSDDLLTTFGALLKRGAVRRRFLRETT